MYTILYSLYITNQYKNQIYKSIEKTLLGYIIWQLLNIRDRENCVLCSNLSDGSITARKSEKITLIRNNETGQRNYTERQKPNWEWKLLEPWGWRSLSTCMWQWVRSVYAFVWSWYLLRNRERVIFWDFWSENKLGNYTECRLSFEEFASYFKALRNGCTTFCSCLE